MTSQQLELIARRGLTLPEPTLIRLRTVGIWCDANLTVQRRDQDCLIRGQESGGAVNDIGRYIISASATKTAARSTGCSR